MTYDDVRKIGLSFPNVEEGTSYGTPALKVGKNFFVRLREEGDVIVLPMPFEHREAMMAEDPDVYYITDHYLNYEYVLVRLKKVKKDALRELLMGAYKKVSTRRARPRAIKKLSD
jgi:hypothetical protein